MTKRNVAVNDQRLRIRARNNLVHGIHDREVQRKAGAGVVAVILTTAFAVVIIGMIIILITSLHMIASL
jgi:hypothetical protein